MTPALTALVLALSAVAVPAKAPERATIGAGVVRPLFPATPEVERDGVQVAAFRLDRTPVTHAEFLTFVQADPRWRRDRVPRLFADARYLSAWAAPDALGAQVDPRAPVTQVSWFAAKAYCAARGGRLPTEDEWERAAMASETAADGSKDPAFAQRILDWYAKRNEARAVGAGTPNFWGVHDLHGLVWEWVYDFNASMITNDRDASGKFCGAGAAGSQNRNDYASFMRVAFRSSLRADYTTENLGFRCAADAPARSPR